MTSHHILRHLYAVRGHTDLEIAEALVEQEISEANADPLTVSWAEYGLANAKARRGDLSEAHEHMAEALVAIEHLPTHRLTRAILPNHHAFVLLQSSDYVGAANVLNESDRITRKHFIYLDFTLRTYPMLIEALVGPEWLNLSKNDSIRRAKRLSLRTRFFGWRYPNLQPHVQRAYGRLMWTTGQRRKAIRCFEKSIKSARQLGAEYDEARALLDLAAVDDDRRDSWRAEAISLLRRLKAVIPRAEAWQLGDDPDQSCIAPVFQISPSTDSGQSTDHVKTNPVNKNGKAD